MKHFLFLTAIMAMASSVQAQVVIHVVPPARVVVQPPVVVVPPSPVGVTVPVATVTVFPHRPLFLRGRPYHPVAPGPAPHGGTPAGHSASPAPDGQTHEGGSPGTGGAQGGHPATAPH